MLNVFTFEYFLLFVFLLAAIDLLELVDVFSDFVVCAICSLMTYRLYRKIKLLAGEDTASQAGLAKEFMHKVVVNCGWFFGITSLVYLMDEFDTLSWDTIDIDLTVGKFLLIVAIMMLCAISIIHWIHRVFWAFDKLELEDKALFDGARNNNEITVLKQSLTQMKTDSERYLERIKQQQKNKLEREAQISFAGDVQRSFLPDLEALNRELEGTGYVIKGGMKANEGIGGDMYDCRRLDDDHILIMIADVSGEGVTAAVFMMLTQALVYSSAEAKTPGVIMQRTNEYLVKHNANKLFVTMWLGIVELSTGKITYASAGHNPPILRGADREAVWINEKPNLVLAAMPKRKYKEYERFIEPGGVLYLYTDGISEARDGNKDFFGNDRLIESVKNARGPMDVVTDVANFVDKAPQSDDMTYLWLERREGGGRMEWQYEVSFKAVPDALETILHWTNEKARSLLTEKRAQMRMCLALEEAVVNVVKYAYSGCEREPVLIIRMKVENNTLVAQLQDQGVPFNPVENIIADPNLKLSERKTGGWGRAIMVGFTDKSSYRYEEPYNILTLEKKNEAEVIRNSGRVKK